MSNLTLIWRNMNVYPSVVAETGTNVRTILVAWHSNDWNFYHANGEFKMIRRIV